MTLEEQLGIDSESTPTRLYWEKVNNYLESLFESDLKDVNRQLFTEKLCNVFNETDFPTEENKLVAEEYDLLTEKTMSEYYLSAREVEDCDWFPPTNAYVYILKYYFNVIRVKSGDLEKTPEELFAFYPFDNYQIMRKSIMKWKSNLLLYRCIRVKNEEYVTNNLSNIVKLFDKKALAVEFYESNCNYKHKTLVELEEELSASIGVAGSTLVTFLANKILKEHKELFNGITPNKLSGNQLLNKWRQSGSCVVKPEDAFACGFENFSEFMESLIKLCNSDYGSARLKECFAIASNHHTVEDWRDLLDLYHFERACEESFSELEEEFDDYDYAVLFQKTNSCIPAQILDFFDENVSEILECIGFDIDDYDYDQFQEEFKNLTAAQVKLLMLVQCKRLSNDGHPVSIKVPDEIFEQSLESGKEIISRID